MVVGAHEGELRSSLTNPRWQIVLRQIRSWTVRSVKGVMLESGRRHISHAQCLTSVSDDIYVLVNRILLRGSDGGYPPSVEYRFVMCFSARWHISS